jgi:DNA-binding MarR family transcriptional regulator
LLDVDSPDSEQFEVLYSRLTRALRRAENGELSRNGLELLHHLPVTGDGTVSLQHLAQQLALPKSTASALVKDLERRGLLSRARNPKNERELAIELTRLGAERVTADSMLDAGGLAAALAALSPKQRRRLLKLLERLVAAAEAAVKW